MPIFMDRHDIVGVTAQDVAEAHQKDLKVQDKHGCKALTYWFDEERGTAFCLIDADNKEAVEAMHDEAHGLIPHRIIEVNSNLVETFLGRIEDPKVEEKTGNKDLLIIEEPAFRAILIAELKNTPSIYLDQSITSVDILISRCRNIIQKKIEKFNGRKVEIPVDGYIASFASVTNAIQSSIEIQSHFMGSGSQETGMDFQLGIGISAGDPITQKEDFFGEVVQSAVRLCHIASEGEIALSSVVKEQFKKENFGQVLVTNSLKSLDPVDEDFLNRLMDTIEVYWNQDGLNVEELSRQIGVSRSQLYRKITKITGESAASFVKEYRLKKALNMIENRRGNVSQIAYESGFNNPSYFSKCFLKKFGILPSDYANRIG